ncbi:dihydroxyacetone phosphate acyltransferase-like [Xenia sp. Carnegie-2017]|uniref:dihydroxyacetone phosphate acyltransferase-like n=1 Tax=Xenia sp. Carnegie-2017 TaxID=2897299 RepID=UPI001F03F52A|nr:dihydroxyacetone phosphate acyltransferase-like [Xenia sp. Carnegie-2017]
MDSFETIKQHGSDILFTLHDFDPPITPVNDHSATTGLNGAKIIEHVLHSVRVKNAASEFADMQGKTDEDILKEVKEMLNDIGHTFSLKSIRFMAFILRKVFRNIFSGIKVNMNGLNKVKLMSKECPVILVPTHRSYTDFLIVSFVCFIFQLPMPVIAAAQDFKSMKLIGGLLRNCGAFYMKRRFRSDILYWLVFSEYVQCLLLNSGTTMEFFLEGTRSRSGKSLLPKLGLMSIITDLYFSSRVPDIKFCPISISYDRVLEETLMARELLGVPKPKESLKGLLSSRSVLSDDYGHVYMYFGEPISLREFSQDYVDRSMRSCIPRSIRSEATNDEMNAVRKLAAYILEKIQDHLIILPNMIVASILLQNATGTTLEFLKGKYQSVLELCQKFNVPVVRNDEKDIMKEIMESLKLLKSSVEVTKENEIFLIDPEHYPKKFKDRVLMLCHQENMNSITAASISSEDGHCREAKDEKISESLSADEKLYMIHLTCVHLQLAHQRNQLLHWFYIPAIIALVSGSSKEVMYSQDELYRNVKLVGDLVSAEVGKEQFPSYEFFIAALKICQLVGILHCHDDRWKANETDDYCYITWLWRPIVISYWIISSFILDSSCEEHSVNMLVKSCQDRALDLFLIGTTKVLETQSLELFRNAIKSLGKLNVVKALKRDSEQVVIVSDQSHLYNIVITLEKILDLRSERKPYLTSKM